MPEWFWCLTRHEDVQMANRDAETFSSGRGGAVQPIIFSGAST